MNDPDLSINEDQLAEKLEKVHQDLIDSQGSDDGGAATDETGDNESFNSILLPAQELFQLIRRVRQHGLELGSGPRRDTRTISAAQTQCDLFDGDVLARPGTAEIPQRLGRFEIRKQLGQGGYGVVFLAHDNNLDREVALKIPRPEVITTPGLKDRFIKEAKAASALSHPNIVTVFEAGKDGPIYYIAYEFVHGTTLDQWLNENNNAPSPTLAAQLVATLAEAIEHAHRRGVVHRDLKPSNILLELNANDLESADFNAKEFANTLRIADFGLAKYLEWSDEATRTGAIVGTPAYMSPEQSHGKDEIGPATDIYSLGVVLYRMLTSRLPFSGSSLVETLRGVQQSEPTPPSRFNPEVPRDLEAIVQKCMEKIPENRYESAFCLQQDLQHYLAGRPVSARPVTRLERLGRWARRNPALATSASLATGFLVLALLASTIGWMFTSAALRRESVAKSQAQLAQNEAEDQFKKHKQSVDQYFSRIGDNPRIRGMPQAEPLRKELLELALVYYQQFAEEAQGDPELQLEVVQKHLRAGQLLDELRMPTEALEQFERTLALADQQLDTDPDSKELLSAQGSALFGAAKSQMALGDVDQSIPLAEQAIEIHAILADRFPDDSQFLKNLIRMHQTQGVALIERNENKDALACFSSANRILSDLRELQPDDAELTLMLTSLKGNRSTALRNLDQFVESEQLVDEVLDDLLKVIKTQSTSWEAQSMFAVAALQKSGLRLMKQDHDSAEEILTEAQPIIDSLCLSYPEFPQYLRYQSGINQRLAICFDRRAEYELAETCFEKSLGARKTIMSLDQGSWDAKGEVAIAALNFGSFLARHKKDLEKAEQLFLEAKEIFERRQQQSPRNQLQSELGIANCLTNLSGVSRDTGQFEKALEYATESTSIFQRLRSNHPANPQIRFYSFNALSMRAAALDRLKRHEEAIADRELVISFAPPPLKDLARLDLALTHILNGDFDPALGIIDQLQQPTVGLPKMMYRLAECYALLAEKNTSGGASEKNDQRSSYIEKSIEYLDRAAKGRYLSTRQRLEELMNDPNFNVLRDKPEFMDIIEDVKNTIWKDVGNGA